MVGPAFRSYLSPDSGKNYDLNEGRAWVFAVDDPLVALQSLARAYRRALGARVLGITGSVGKTSVKDIARALLPGAVHANSENLNTEIGLPLTVLEAPAGTDVLVLEMAMRGAGQIAELAAIAEPEVAVITNVGPVHVELLGSVEAIAAAKAEVLAALPADGTAVVPAEAAELEPHLGQAPRLLRFGPGGDVEAIERRVVEGVTEASIATPAGSQAFHFPFAEAHNLTNALAAVAAGVALGAPLGRDGRSRCEHRLLPLPGRAPRAGRRDRPRERLLQRQPGLDAGGARPPRHRSRAQRRIAVLGEMAELGPGAPAYHREVGAHARAAGVDLLVGVGEPARDYDPDELVGAPEEAAELLAAQLERGDAILVKGSRSAGLEASPALKDMVGGSKGGAAN